MTTAATKVTFFSGQNTFDFCSIMLYVGLFHFRIVAFYCLVVANQTTGGPAKCLKKVFFVDPSLVHYLTCLLYVEGWRQETYPLSSVFYNIKRDWFFLQYMKL